MRWFVLLCTLCVASPISAQGIGWEPTGQAAWPYHPSVGEITRTASGTLVSCPFGDNLYRSTDGGDTWANVQSTQATLVCSLVSADEGVLFSGTSDGVYRSEDDGVTWSPAGLAGRWVYDLERGPAGALWGVVLEEDFEGTFDRELVRSDDGETWTLVAVEADIEASSGSSFVGSFRTVSIDPAGVVFVGTASGLFRSPDAGTSWDEIDFAPSVPVAIPSSGVTFASASVAYIGVKRWFETGQGIYRSTDGGVTWSATESPDLYVHTIAVVEGGAVLAGTTEGVYQSADGLLWEEVGLNMSARQVTAILSGTGDEPVLVGTDKGVYRSALEGASWERIDEGFRRALIVDAVAINGETLLASANGEVYRFDPVEERWVLPANIDLLTRNRASILLAYDDLLYYGTSAGLFLSQDDAETWDALWLETEDERFATAAVLEGGMLAVGTSFPGTVVQDGRLLFSDDGGATWTASEGWDTNPGGIPGAIAETSQGTILVGAAVGKFFPGDLYRSDNDGATWTPQLDDEAYLGEQPTAIAATPSVVVALSPSTHFRSLDDGQTWEATVSFGGDRLAVTPNEGVVAIRSDREVYYSADEGLGWVQVSVGLAATSLATDAESYVYVGTDGRGVLRSPEPFFVGTESSSEATRFGLSSPYPNPIASSTSISFALPEPTSVTLAVHDVLGRHIATLVDSVLPAGNHEARWAAGSVASGVYLITLHAGTQRATQRVSVAR